MDDARQDLVEVSTPLLLLSMTPILAMAIASARMNLKLESQIVVGICRTFVQLTILGLILQPIFAHGQDLGWIIVL